MDDVSIKQSNVEIVKPKPDTVQEALKKMMPQFAMVLPKHLTPERLCRVAINACHSTPKLLDCDRKSLYSAVMRAAQLGLEPDGVLGQAYLIPFKRNFKNASGEWQNVMEVQFIVGYKGLIDLARRSGDVSNIIAKEVYSADEFSIDWSQEIPFVHKPKMDGERGQVTHFWAMARFKDGGFHWDYLTVAEVNAIRDKGNGGKNAVWSDHYIEMGKKTAIRRIAKYLPMSVQKAAITEDLVEAGKSFSVTDYGDIVIEGNVETPPNDTKGNDAVKSKLARKAAKAAGADPETGELPTDSTVSKKETIAEKKPEPEPKRATVIPSPDLLAIKAIPMGTLPNDSTQQDFEAWKTEFVKGCDEATTLPELAQFYKVNIHMLNQIKSRAPAIFEQCETCYIDSCDILRGQD